MSCPACGSNAPDVGISFGGVDEFGESHVYLEFLLASWGGGPDRDGMDACTGTLVNYSNAPAEMIEADQPIVVERYALVPDSGGPGRYRGGLALERHLRFKANRATLQIRSDRRDHPPYGLDGGGCGAPSNVSILRADGREEACPAKFLTTVDDGDILRVRLAGGGGHGDPFRREPERGAGGRARREDDQRACALGVRSRDRRRAAGDRRGGDGAPAREPGRCLRPATGVRRKMASCRLDRPGQEPPGSAPPDAGTST